MVVRLRVIFIFAVSLGASVLAPLPIAQPLQLQPRLTLASVPPRIRDVVLHAVLWRVAPGPRLAIARPKKPVYSTLQARPRTG